MAEPKKITIHPVTRVEGHAKITLQLDSSGQVSEARFHVDEFRGFEKFCEGRYFTEMPSLMPRICGICPVSHAVASAKACEAIQRVTIPPAADRLRRLLHLGQIVASHALSFFYLSSPDFLLDWDADPAERNIVGVAKKFPDLARRGIRLRQFGQEISGRITGKRVHSIGIVAGGMANTLTEANRVALLGWIDEALGTASAAVDIFKRYRDKHPREVDAFAAFESLYMGLTGPKGEHELYDGKLRFVAADGRTVLEGADPARYLEWIAEKPVQWSYLKLPYYKPFGYPKGVYRVGPLARLNVASSMRTPLAEAEFREFKKIQGQPVHGSFYYHYARLIETLACIEEIARLLADPGITSTDVLSQAGRNASEGIGCSEAPRGTLFHHYTVDDNGILTRVNLLIATGQNNPAMNRAILEVARQFLNGREPSEGALNRIEGAIRCYDPCLSCSTHAVGSMPLVIEMLEAGGRLLHTIRRG